MAQLNDTMVQGDLRVTGTMFGSTASVDGDVTADRFVGLIDDTRSRMGVGYTSTGTITADKTYAELKDIIAKNDRNNLYASTRNLSAGTTSGYNTLIPLSKYDQSPNNTRALYFTGVHQNELHSITVSSSDTVTYSVKYLVTSDTDITSDELEPLLTKNRFTYWGKQIYISNTDTPSGWIAESYNTDTGDRSTGNMLLALGPCGTSADASLIMDSQGHTNFTGFGLDFRSSTSYILMYKSTDVISYQGGMNFGHRAITTDYDLSKMRFYGTASYADYATQSGSCTGNAATAGSATYDSDGNAINATYFKANSGTTTLQSGTAVTIGTQNSAAVKLQLPTIPAAANNGALKIGLNGGTASNLFLANQSGDSTLTFASGSTDGTISVGGTDVSVAGWNGTSWNNHCTMFHSEVLNVTDRHTRFLKITFSGRVGRCIAIILMSSGTDSTATSMAFRLSWEYINSTDGIKNIGKEIFSYANMDYPPLVYMDSSSFYIGPYSDLNRGATIAVMMTSEDPSKVSYSTVTRAVATGSSYTAVPLTWHAVYSEDIREIVKGSVGVDPNRLYII